MHGRVAAGARAMSLECVDGLACWGATAKADGICAPAWRHWRDLRIAEKDALATFCARERGDAAPGVRGTSAGWRCAARVATGGACAAGAQCAAATAASPGVASRAPPGLAGCTASARAQTGSRASPGVALRRGRRARAARARRTALRRACRRARTGRVCGMQCDAFPQKRLRRRREDRVRAAAARLTANRARRVRRCGSM